MKKVIYNIIFLISYTLIFLYFFYIFKNVIKEANKDKQPLLINKWTYDIKNITGYSISERHLLLTDEKEKLVKIYNKMTGKEKIVLNFSEIPIWAIENNKGDILIIFKGSNKIKKYKENNFINEIKLYELSEPVCMTVDKLKNNIYILDKNGKILKYDENLNFIKQFEKNSNCSFYLPNFICIGGDGYLYLRESFLSGIYILKYDLDGNCIKNLFIMQSNPKRAGLAVDDKGNIYIEYYEVKNMREIIEIRVYNNNGEKIYYFNTDLNRKKFFFTKTLIGFDENNIWGIDNEIFIIKKI